MARLANILNKHSQAEHYKRLAEKIKEAYSRSSTYRGGGAHNLTLKDLKNLKTSTEHNKLIMYFSLMVTGQYLRTLAITNNLGEQIVKNITETQKAVTRLWAVSNVLFGVTVKGIKDSMADTTKDFSDFLDELEKTDAKTLEDKLDSEAIVLASAGNNLLTEVCKKISAIFS